MDHMNAGIKCGPTSHKKLCVKVTYNKFYSTPAERENKSNAKQETLLENPTREDLIGFVHAHTISEVPVSLLQ